MTSITIYLSDSVAHALQGDALRAGKHRDAFISKIVHDYHKSQIGKRRAAIREKRR